MTCAEVRRYVPGYLDDALPKRFNRDARARMDVHLQGCEQCRHELDRYVQLSSMMAGATNSAAPPEGLALGIRVALANARAERSSGGRIVRWKNRVQLILENILEPLAVPATGGLLAALIVFVIVYHQFAGIGMPLGVAVADLPNNLLQPARLETLAGFRMSRIVENDSAEQHPLLVEATVSAAGEAVSYRVISGQVDEAMRRELDQILLFSRFRPQLSFGRPLSGGRVILSFNTISVRG